MKGGEGRSEKVEGGRRVNEGEGRKETGDKR
jgi:hypothetical protein